MSFKGSVNGGLSHPYPLRETYGPVHDGRTGRSAIGKNDVRLREEPEVPSRANCSAVNEGYLYAQAPDGLRSFA